MAALVIATITGIGAGAFHLTQDRNDKIYNDIEADIRETLRQHELRRLRYATLEQPAPPATTGSAAKKDKNNDKADEAKARKAKTASIRKRAAGQRRERFVPPDFARLPIALARGALGFMR